MSLPAWWLPGTPLDADPCCPTKKFAHIRRVIEAVLDTGFTGHLCLARRHRRSMNLRLVGEVETGLADGSRTMQPVYLGTITFFGVARPVFVTLTRSSDSLIGTALLLNRQVHLDFSRHTLTMV